MTQCNSVYLKTSSCPTMSFTYSKAVLRQIPASLPDAALRQCASGRLPDLERSREQHRQYEEVIRSLVPEVHVLPADDGQPDCCFVEDTVVVCGNTALITIPGHPSRCGETQPIRAIMQQLGIRMVEMVGGARMDGGDVLYTGREFFVGLSSRTNQEGLCQLSAAFPGYPVTAVPVEEGLHLKSFCSMAGPDLICIGSSQAACAGRAVMEAAGHHRYSYLVVPDDIGANCLYINGTVVHVSEDAFPKSAAVFEKLACKRIALSASELNIVDGALTCCSVLIP